MATIAEKLAKRPTKAIEQIADEVQGVANQSQSFAYRFEDFEDGSRLEIRCAPVPALDGLPEGEREYAGALAVIDGTPVLVFPLAHVERTNQEVAERVAACEAALATAETAADVEAIEQALAAARVAEASLAENLAAAVQSDSHVGIPVDEKTAAYLEELGPGGRAFIAH